MNSFKTVQEEFWAGEFGDQYVDRNKGHKLLASNTTFFTKVLTHTRSVKSVIEFGANIGLNLRAIKTILPEVNLAAVEINKKAVLELKNWGEAEVFDQSILDYVPYKTWDFVLVKGVLIHLNPEVLPRVYDLLYNSSGRYICIAEYYNPTPVEITYRGYAGVLFKRDFAGEMLDRYNDLHLLEYGFVYHRDNNFPQDDISWFLMEKSN